MLGFMELRDEDQPAEEIWLDQDALTEHFGRVRDRYKDGKSSGSGWEEIPNATMQENDLAKEIRRRASKGG